MAVGGGLEGLETAQLHHGIVGVCLADHGDSFGLGLLDLADGLGFTLGLLDGRFLLRLGMKNHRLLVGLGLKDHRLLLSFGNQDSALLLTFGDQDGLTALTLCAHLLLHGLLDGIRRHDVLDLDAVHLDSPRVRSLVQDGAHLAVDDISGSQRLVQLKLSDDVPQRGRRKVL